MLHSLLISISLFLLSAQVGSSFYDPSEDCNSACAHEICHPKNHTFKNAWKPVKRFKLCSAWKDDTKNSSNGSCLEFAMGNPAEVNDSTEFAKEVSQGAVLADYSNCWSKCWEREAQKTTLTEMPTTTTTLAPFQNCSMAWENFLVAKLDGIEGNTTEFAARVGYIEPPTRPINRIQLIDEFLELQDQNFPGGEKYNISGWISSNDWIKKLKWDDGIRYIPLPLQNGTDQVLKMRMSILVLRCDFAAFGISPLAFDIILSNNSEVKNNWTQDFAHLETCDKTGKIFNGHVKSFVEQQISPQEVELLTKVGIEMKNNGKLSQQQIEAHKFKYGYSTPLRTHEMDYSCENLERVKNDGLFLGPPEEAYQASSKEYFFVANFITIPSHWGEKCHPTDASTVKAQIVQEAYMCSGFNIYFPRFVGRLKLADCIEYTNMADKFCISEPELKVLISEKLNDCEVYKHPEKTGDFNFLCLMI